jgi:hypothetical protein
MPRTYARRAPAKKTARKNKSVTSTLTADANTKVITVDYHLEISPESGCDLNSLVSMCERFQSAASYIDQKKIKGTLKVTMPQVMDFDLGKTLNRSRY